MLVTFPGFSTLAFFNTVEAFFSGGGNPSGMDPEPKQTLDLQFEGQIWITVIVGENIQVGRFGVSL